MAKKNTANTYDITRDMIIAKPMVLHIDDATGSQVSAAGEGVSTFAVCLRRMMKEDGSAGEVRISVQTAYVSKGSANAQARWVVGSDGAPSLSAKPAAGELCIASAIGRVSPAVAATLFTRTAAYAAKVSAALAAKAKTSKAA